MSSLPVQPPARRHIPRLYVAVGVVLCAAALAASLGAKPHAQATIDGVSRPIEPGATVADLAEAGHLRGRPGRMVSLSGRVLEVTSGVPPRVWRNGRPVTAERVVYEGDVITSADGANTLEEVVTKREPIAFARRVVGSGPLVTLVSPGSPGVRQLRVGAVSGDVVTSTVVKEPSPMVVRRYGAQPNQKLVALTFDDGPWPGQTEKILRVLRQHKVKASFFMIGYLARRYPSIAEKVAAEGHVVGNHTAGHRMLTKLTSAAVDTQIAQGAGIIERSTGQTPEWFRPPGGDISPAVWSRIRRVRLKVALWDVDPQDWRGIPSPKIAHDVVTRVRPGAIVLLHDGGGDRTQTIRALPVIIRALKSRGYRFVTLDEMPQR